MVLLQGFAIVVGVAGTLVGVAAKLVPAVLAWLRSVDQLDFRVTWMRRRFEIADQLEEWGETEAAGIVRFQAWRAYERDGVRADRMLQKVWRGYAWQLSILALVGGLAATAIPVREAREAAVFVLLVGMISLTILLVTYPREGRIVNRRTRELMQARSIPRSARPTENPLLRDVPLATVASRPMGS